MKELIRIRVQYALRQQFCKTHKRPLPFTNKHTAKLHHVGSLYILTYDERKLKHKVVLPYLTNKNVLCASSILCLLT